MKNKINVMILIGCLIATGTLSAVFAFPAKTPKQRLNEIHKLLPKTFDNGNFSLVLSLEFEAGYIIENYQLEKSDAFASICFGIAKRYMMINNYHMALVWLERALDLTPQENELSLVYSFFNMGMIYGEQKKWKLSNEICNKAWNLVEKHRHAKYFKRDIPPYYPSAILFQMGKNEDESGNYLEAVSFYIKGIKECSDIEDKEVKSQLESDILMYLGDSYQKTKAYIFADEYYMSALENLKSVQDNEYVIRKSSQIYYRLALSNYSQNNVIKAKEYIRFIPDENSFDNDNQKLSEKISKLYDKLHY